MQDGSIYPLSPITAGVMQGCPLSSVLFLLCIDPLLWLFASTFVKADLGDVFVCAADSAVSLEHLETLIPIAQYCWHVLYV